MGKEHVTSNDEQILIKYMAFPTPDRPSSKLKTYSSGIVIIVKLLPLPKPIAKPQNNVKHINVNTLNVI